MNIIIQDQHHYVLRFSIGEDFMSGLQGFAREKGIEAATFQAIGASGKLTLGYYNLESKTYTDKNFDEDLEIVTITGNIALKDDAPVIHAHGSFSNVEMQMFGGHIKQLTVGASCEVSLVALAGKMIRKFDEAVGLPLLQCDA